MKDFAIFLLILIFASSLEAAKMNIKSDGELAYPTTGDILSPTTGGAGISLDATDPIFYGKGDNTTGIGFDTDEVGIWTSGTKRYRFADTLAHIDPLGQTHIDGYNILISPDPSGGTNNIDIDTNAGGRIEFSSNNSVEFDGPVWAHKLGATVEINGMTPVLQMQSGASPPVFKMEYGSNMNNVLAVSPSAESLLFAGTSGQWVDIITDITGEFDLTATNGIDFNFGGGTFDINGSGTATLAGGTPHFQLQQASELQFHNGTVYKQVISPLEAGDVLFMHYDGWSQVLHNVEDGGYDWEDDNTLIMRLNDDMLELFQGDDAGDGNGGIHISADDSDGGAYQYVDGAGQWNVFGGAEWTGSTINGTNQHTARSSSAVGIQLYSGEGHLYADNSVTDNNTFTPNMILTWSEDGVQIGDALDAGVTSSSYEMEIYRTASAINLALHNDTGGQSIAFRLVNGANSWYMGTNSSGSQYYTQLNGSSILKQQLSGTRARVGIGHGTSGVDNELHVQETNSSGAVGIKVENDSSNAAAYGMFAFRTSDADSQIRNYDVGSNLSRLDFHTDVGGGVNRRFYIQGDSGIFADGEPFVAADGEDHGYWLNDGESDYKFIYSDDSTGEPTIDTLDMGYNFNLELGGNGDLNFTQGYTVKKVFTREEISRSGTGTNRIGATTAVILNNITDEMNLQYVVPDDWNGASDMTLTVLFYPLSPDVIDDTETIVFDLEYKSITAGDVIADGSEATATGTYAQSGAGADSESNEVVITLDYDNVTSPITAGDYLHLLLNWDTVTSTYPDANICILNLVLEYTANKQQKN